MGSLTPQNIFHEGFHHKGTTLEFIHIYFLSNMKKQKWVIFTSNNLGSITQTFVLRGFLQGLTSMTINLNQQYPPLALMETLWCNIEIISLMLPLEPCLCPLHLINLLPLEPCLYPLHLINLSPFVINGKGIFPSRAAPPDRTVFLWCFFVYI